MPNFSGIWSPTEQFQARAQNIWPAPPGAPTIGTATAGGNNCASVTFTAPGCTGRFPAGITNYTAISTPGCIAVSGASSPVTVTGLTNGTSYTFQVRANGTNGLSGPLSAASNSITASLSGSQSYTAAGTYSWVAPAGVTSVSAVAVGGGGNGSRWSQGCCNFSTGGAGGGGSLSYKNNIAVTPGTSYSVVVGGGGGGQSRFTTVAVANGGANATGICGLQGGAGGVRGAGDGGGNGGCGSNARSAQIGGGGGAGGYSGNGGNGGASCLFATAGSGGGGGGGGSNPGGGVGLFGQGGNGAAGSGSPGGGGSGGTAGVNGGSPGGGLYGGGGAGRPASNSNPCFAGAQGAVRIIWPGNTRSFPSTNAGNP